MVFNAALTENKLENIKYGAFPFNYWYMWCCLWNVPGKYNWYKMLQPEWKLEWDVGPIAQQPSSTYAGSQFASGPNSRGWSWPSKPYMCGGQPPILIWTCPTIKAMFRGPASEGNPRQGCLGHDTKIMEFSPQEDSLSTSIIVMYQWEKTFLCYLAVPHWPCFPLIHLVQLFYICVF